MNWLFLRCLFQLTKERIVVASPLRARFTNSLNCQHKLSFGVKIVLSGFTKDYH